jgi:mannitol-1-phosphate/altronate dehydrogenase
MGKNGFLQVILIKGNNVFDENKKEIFPVIVFSCDKVKRKSDNLKNVIKKLK